MDTFAQSRSCQMAGLCARYKYAIFGVVVLNIGEYVEYIRARGKSRESLVFYRSNDMLHGNDRGLVSGKIKMVIGEISRLESCGIM